MSNYNSGSYEQGDRRKPVAPPIADLVDREPAYTPHESRKGLGCLALAIPLGIATILASNSISESNRPRPPYCEIQEATEDPSKKEASLRFSTPVDGIVQVIAFDDNDTPVLLQNASPKPEDPTLYTFNSTGLHDYRLTAQAGRTPCKGLVVLGTPDSGDEGVS